MCFRISIPTFYVDSAVSFYEGVFHLLHRSTIRAELVLGLVEVLETSLYNLKLEELMAASPWMSGIQTSI